VSRVIRRKIAEGAEVVTTYGVPDNEQERIVADLRRDFEQSDYDTTILEGYAADRAVQPEAPTTEAGRRLVDMPYSTAGIRESRDDELAAAVVAIEAEVRAASQERPQPELPIWTEEQVAEGWIDPSPEACTCQRKDALGSYVPCSLHDVGVAQERPQPDPTTSLTSVSTSLVVQWREAFEAHDQEHQGIGGLHPESCDEWIANRVGVAQERPSIDVIAEALHAMGDACGPFTADHPAAMHNSQAAAILARLAGGSVASPEPDE
jgi:hypothetical protein